MRSHSYLNSAKKIIEAYDGTIPLSAWLKDYYRVNKKFGSKDRKEVSHVCYCFFRLGNSFIMQNQEERMLIALFLCSDNSNMILKELKPDWNDIITDSLERKLKLVAVPDEAAKIFPFTS